MAKRKRKVFAFVGPKGAGKDTAYSLFRTQSPRDTIKLSFAHGLKKLVSEVYGLSYKHLDDPVLKEGNFANPILMRTKELREIKRMMPLIVPDVDRAAGVKLYDSARAPISHLEGRVAQTPRQLLQWIGTDLIRVIYPDWHIIATLKDDKWDNPRYKQIIATDCRFVNEFEALKARFGSAKLIYIEREKAEEKLKSADHVSEKGILELKAIADEVVQNNDDKDDFKKALLKVVK